MPKRKTSVRSGSTKRTKPSTRRGDQVMRVPRLIVPNEIITDLAYGDVWDFAAGALAYAHNLFRINSCYDPDYSGVGGTPSGFANWCGATKFYSKYSVHAVTMQLEVLATHATQTGLVGMVFGGESFAFPTTGVEYQQIALEGDTSVARALNAAPYEGATVRLRARRAIAEVAGVVLANDMSNTANYNANPPINVYCDVFCVNADGTTIGITCRVIVRITYTVRFFDRNSSIVD